MYIQKLSLDILLPHAAEEKSISQHTNTFFLTISKLFGVAIAMFPFFVSLSFALAFHLPFFLILLLLLPLCFVFTLLHLFPPLPQFISSVRSPLYCQRFSYFLQKCLIPLVLTGSLLARDKGSSKMVH